MSESLGEELQRISQSKQSKNPVLYIHIFHNRNINKALINTSNHCNHSLRGRSSFSGKHYRYTARGRKGQRSRRRGGNEDTGGNSNGGGKNKQ
jgi:hypothetical protein